LGNILSGVLEGKSTIVTGAASGIGRAAAQAFAAAGARLILGDVNIEGGEETAAIVRAAGGSARFVRADVSSETDVKALVAAAVSEYGGLDRAFNNAGVTPDRTLTADLSLEAWERTLRINLTSVFLCVREELRAMLASRAGAIVNTSSGLGLVGQEGCVAYAAAKAGILSLTRCAAIEHAKQNIRVNALLPGVIDTGLLRNFPPEVTDVIRSKHPIGRLGEPDEVAQAALWLLSDAASFVTGSSMVVDGGFLAV
jgi:NAD(P)-dependent dehydrogenase (short-subunit alcohol dehydrogenase family)